MGYEKERCFLSFKLDSLIRAISSISTLKIGNQFYRSATRQKE